MQGTSTSHQPIACNGCSENGAVMCRSRSITSPTFYSEMPSPQLMDKHGKNVPTCFANAGPERRDVHVFNREPFNVVTVHF